MTEIKVNNDSDFVSKYVNLLSEITDAPEEYQEAAAIFLLSTVVGRNWKFKSIPDTKIFSEDQDTGGRLLNLWIIILGKSRVSRKTSGVLKHIQNILDDTIGPSKALTKSFTPEFLIKEMATKTEENAGERTTQCYWIKDEVSGFFKMLRKKDSYMAETDDILSSIYDGTSTSRGTIGREQETVENPYLTCYLASTDFLPTLFDEMQIRLGFLNRFIFIVGKRKKRKELRIKELNEEEKQTAKEIKEFLRALAAKKSVTIMEITEDAKPTYDSFEKSIEDRIESEDLDLKEGYCAQLPNIVVRLSCLFRIARLSIDEVKKHTEAKLVVEKQDVKKAIAYSTKIWQWFEEIIAMMKSPSKIKMLPIEMAADSIVEFLSDDEEKHVNIIKDYVTLQNHVSSATFYKALAKTINERKVEKTRQGYYKLKNPEISSQK